MGKQLLAPAKKGGDSSVKMALFPVWENEESSHHQNNYFFRKQRGKYIYIYIYIYIYKQPMSWHVQANWKEMTCDFSSGLFRIS